MKQDDVKVQKFEGPLQKVWDASSLDSYKRCPRYYQYSVIERWRFKSGEKVASHWGTGFHHGVEHFYTAKFKGLEHDACIDYALVALGKWLEENHLAETDNARTGATLYRAVVWYADHWKDEPFTTEIMFDGTPALESRFEVPIPGTDLRLSGRLDRVAQWGELPVLIDHKTTGKALNKYYFDMYKPNIQTTAYAWAHNKLFGVIPTIVIDAVQVAVTLNRFARATIDFTQAELDEFEKDMKIWVNQATELNDYFPKNETSCSMFGGCYYLRVCKQSPEYRQIWLESDYAQAPPR